MNKDYHILLDEKRFEGSSEAFQKLVKEIIIPGFENFCKKIKESDEPTTTC